MINSTSPQLPQASLAVSTASSFATLRLPVESIQPLSMMGKPGGAEEIALTGAPWAPSSSCPWAVDSEVTAPLEGAQRGCHPGAHSSDKLASALTCLAFSSSPLLFLGLLSKTSYWEPRKTFSSATLYFLSTTTGSWGRSLTIALSNAF